MAAPFSICDGRRGLHGGSPRISDCERLSRTTIFSFGYWGSGGATKGLVEAVDAAEAARGFEPPLWVDIRISRSVRSVGFNENNFATLLGDRYVWMDELGNKRVKEKRSGIEIQTPKAAQLLLALALRSSKRRLLFFCACERPAHCHRKHVGKLLLKYAKRQSVSVSVIEWPGGQAGTQRLEVAPSTLRKIRQGILKTLPLPASMTLGVAAAIPWGTIATIEAGSETVKVLIGPARVNSAGCHIRVHPEEVGTEANSDSFRKEWGYESVS